MGDMDDMNKWWKLFLALGGTPELSCLYIFLNFAFIFFSLNISFHAVAKRSQLNNFTSFADADQSNWWLSLRCFVLLIHLNSYSLIISEKNHLLLSRPRPWPRQPISRSWKNVKLAWDSDILMSSSVFYWWAPYICRKWVILTHILHRNTPATLLFYCSTRKTST